MNAIEVKGVSKRYKGYTLDNISFDLPYGSILGLVGENGAGKSTTINLIMAATSMDSGSINVLGVDNKDSAFAHTKQDIGIVLDEAYFPEVLTASMVGKVMAKTYVNWNKDLYDDYLSRMDLPLTKPFNTYSRGMRMKLAIAVALSHDPKLLVLDEATSGLDPMVREELLDTFADFAKDGQHSVLLSSHIVSDLEKICDYIAFIHKGELLLCEKTSVLMDEYVVAVLTDDELKAIPASAVKGVKHSAEATEVLMLRSELPDGASVKNTTLEDIIVFLARGGKN